MDAKNWRRDDVKDARQAYLQCVGTEGKTLEDFVVWKPVRAPRSEMEEKKLRDSQLEMLNAFLANGQ